MYKITKKYIVINVNERHDIFFFAKKDNFKLKFTEYKNFFATVLIYEIKKKEKICIYT